MSALLAFAGYDDPPMPPGGIRFRTFVPPSYKSDYLPGMDLRSAPVQPDPLGGYGSWLDDLLGGGAGSAGAAATDAVTQTLVAQIPVITAAVLSSPAYKAEVSAVRQQAVVGGLVLAALIVGGVYLTK